MKTTEQIKSEVITYLNKTSIHLFTKENGEFFKVLIEGDNFIIINGLKVNTYNINYYVSSYGANAKNVIKHLLFLDRKVKSIKNYKTMRNKMSIIKDSISDKIDNSEINKIVTSLITGIPIVLEEKKSFISKLFGK